MSDEDEKQLKIANELLCIYYTKRPTLINREHDEMIKSVWLLSVIIPYILSIFLPLFMKYNSFKSLVLQLLPIQISVFLFILISGLFFVEKYRKIEINTWKKRTVELNSQLSKKYKEKIKNITFLSDLDIALQA